MKKQTKRKGFSLIELMVVIIILGLLAALVMPNLVGKSEQAKQKLVCVQMKSIGEALKMFKIDMGTYPSTEEGMSALVKNPDSSRYTSYPKSGYLDGSEPPKDPWQNAYIYIGMDNGFELISLGGDGKEGGEDENGDIKYSTCNK